MLSVWNGLSQARKQKSSDILAKETLPKKQVEQAVEIHVTVSRKYFRPTAKTRRQSDVTRKSAQNQFIPGKKGSSAGGKDEDNVFSQTSGFGSSFNKGFLRGDSGMSLPAPPPRIVPPV